MSRLEIYRQLARMPTAFPIHITSKILPASTVSKLVDQNPMRIYIAFQLTPPVAGDLLIPFNDIGTTVGFLLATGYLNQEFWIEKHKGMVTQRWDYSRTTAAAMTMNIVEMFYAPSGGE